MVNVNHPVASNIAVDVSKHRLSSIIAFLANVRRVLSMVFVRSLDGHLDTCRRVVVVSECVHSFVLLLSSIDIHYGCVKIKYCTYNNDGGHM